MHLDMLTACTALLNDFCLIFLRLRQSDQVIANMINTDNIIRRTTTIVVTFEDSETVLLGITKTKNQKVVISY